MTAAVGLPAPRGPLSAAVAGVLAGTGEVTPDDVLRAARALPVASDAAAPDDVLRDEDLHVALWTLHELHYRAFAGVGDSWEWDPTLLAARGVLEEAFERALRTVVEVPTGVAPEDLPAALFAMTSPGGDDGPSLSAHLARHGTVEQYREMLVHRSIYHLKEADAHTWAIPRLGGAAKAALVEIQADEYGGGTPGRMHQQLYARTMRALDLDDTYGHYIDAVPATTLAGYNAMSLFGLHRRLVGASIGQLTSVEMTSSLPCRMLAQGLRRLGFDRDATWFYDEHVEADAAHEQIAAHDLAGGFARQHPDRTDDVLFGTAAGLALDALAADHLLSSWEAGRSSLRTSLAAAA